jgi:hypothetical protein
LPSDWTSGLSSERYSCASFVEGAIGVLVRSSERFTIWADGGEIPPIPPTLNWELDQSVQQNVLFSLMYDSEILATPQMNIPFGTWDAAYHVYIEVNQKARDNFVAFLPPGVPIGEYQQKLSQGGSRWRGHYDVYGFSMADVPGLGIILLALIEAAKKADRF